MDITAIRIKELRIFRGLTQQTIADYLKMDRGNYSKYERGIFEFSLEMIRKLSKLFGVTSDYLLGLSDDFSPKED